MYVSFGYLDKKLLITLIFPCFIIIRRIIRNKYGDDYNINMNPYMQTSFKLLAFILCGILYLIVKCRTKKESVNKKDNNVKVKNLQSSSSLIVKNVKKEKCELIVLNDDANINPVKEEQMENKKKERKKQLLFVAFLSFLQISGALIKYIWKIEKNLSTDYNQTIDILFQIVFLTAFSIIFLKFSIYSHQILSLTILIICLIPYFIETFIFDKNKNKIFLIIIYFFSVQILFCLSNVLGKKYLNIYIEDIFLLLFKMGIIGWIPLLIYDSIFHLFSSQDTSFHGIIPFFIDLFSDKDELSKKIILFFLDLFCSFLQEMSLWLTVYYFTPCHLFISEVFGEFTDTTLKMFVNYDQNPKQYHIIQEITFYILYPIVIFFVLIFNEIIILNFCELNKNTKYQLNIRQKVDGNYDIDKHGNIIPFNNANRTSYLIEEDEEENNDEQNLFR